MIEPNCDMPWEIYLDWLQDQGNEDLREIDCASLVCGIDTTGFYYTPYDQNFSGAGYVNAFIDWNLIVMKSGDGSMQPTNASGHRFVYNYVGHGVFFQNDSNHIVGDSDDCNTGFGETVTL